MNFAEIVRFALRGIGANKLRSALTMLGILIGVAAVILLVAVGNGSAKAISDRIEALGTNTLTVMSTSRDSGGLTFQPEGGALRGTSWRLRRATWCR